MQEAEQLVIDAINVGLSAMHKVPEEELKEAVLDFIKKYGFLGFMTALPTTADFITYESVYLPKNHFIREESLPTEDCLAYFCPFDKPDFKKNGVKSGWSVADREGIAITMAMGNAPQAVAMGLQKEYAERYDGAFPSCSRIRTVICVCANTVRKPLSQAGRGMSFAARSVRTSLMSTNQEKRKRGTNRIAAKKCLRHFEDCGILNIKKDICVNRCPTGATDRRLARLNDYDKNSRLT